MQVRLLGPIDVLAAGQARPVAGLRRTALLAALATQAGTVVGADRLSELIWGGRPPQAAATTLQSHVSHLRRFLGAGATIRSDPPGYVLDLPADGTDVAAAQRLIREGTAAATAADGARLLRDAVALWRGRPLAELAGWAWFDDQASWLEALLTHAADALTERRLALGEHAALVPELQVRARERPLDEDLHRQLMLARYRAGRQGEALAGYRDLQRALRDELGVEPGPALRALQAAILRHDPALALPGPAPARHSGPAWPVPAQLPVPVAAFTGRETELRRLDDAARDCRDQATAIVISAVSGTAGVGKTALAVTWAHRVAHRFPDGQLYANLRGFDPALAPLPPEAVLRAFLVALGRPPQQIPPDPVDQAGLYRSLLAGRRVLVVLDNARDAQQVRPLLPGAPGCLALVTSRDRLAPLVATEGAASIALPLPDDRTCRALLTRRIRDGRVAAEPDAVTRIIASCSRLPLALAVAAARAATDPDVALADLADQLGGDAVLTTLSAGDAGSDVRSVFSWSLDALPPEPADVFAHLGLHPGPDVGTTAVAVLTGLPAEDARRGVDALAQANLATAPRPDRTALHDLLRAYAAEVGAKRLADDRRDAATRRMLDHYTHSAQAAATCLYGPWDHVVLAPPEPGARVERFDGQPAAAAWLEAEHAVLLAVVEQAATTGWTTHAWQLIYSLGSHLARGGFWHEWHRVLQHVLDASRAMLDERGQAHAHHGLGNALTHLGRYDDAEPHLQRARGLFAALGLPDRQAQTHLALGLVADCRDDPRLALRHARLALALYRATGRRPGQAIALNNFAWSTAQLGHPGLALGPCRAALALHEAAGDRQGQAGAWDSLGYIHFRRGDLPDALACSTRAADLKHALGDRLDEAGTLLRRGDTHQALGDRAAARADWTRAHALYEALHHPDAATALGRLRA